MPVYIQDGKVLLIGLDVAVDTACCDSCCPAITLICDSISASKSKCGFPALHIVDCAPPFTDHGYSTSLNFVGCCSNFGNCAESGGASVDQNTYYLTRDFTFSGHTETGTECFGCGSLCGSGSGSFSYDPITCVGSGDTFDCGGSCCVSGDWILSVEYTTGMLIANTEAALPPYDGDFNDTCYALLDLSDDEKTYTIQRFKPKFTIAAVRDSDLIICYNEHFVPDVGDPVDTPKTVTISAGGTQIVGDEVVEPSENGVITITGVDCCGCNGLATCTVDFTFTYQGSPIFPIGHAFSGSGTVNLDVSHCSDNQNTTILVTVVEHGEFGDTTCVPDAEVILTATAIYDSMSGLWTVNAEVFMGDHSTVCGPEGWPSSSIVSNFSDAITDSGGTFPLVPATSPNMTGTVAFTFS